MFETPDVSDRRRNLHREVAVSLGYTLLLALAEATSVSARLQAGGSTATWLRTLMMMLPSWLLITAVAPLIAALARQFSFERHNWKLSALVHGTLSVTITVAHLAATSATYIIVSEPATWERFSRLFARHFRALCLTDIFAYWAIIGIYLTIRYSNLRTSLVEARLALAEARLTALRTQLNPHFLFNTLHAISVLALKGEHAALADMLGRLSELLRAALDEKAQEVPLSAEMNFVDHYMALQQMRFSDRLQMQKAIAEDTLSGLVPPMILQPIIENAIKHGVDADRGASRVDVSATREGGDLVLEVRDTGPGFPDGMRRVGIGLANTKARLEQLYGARHRFEFGRSSAGGALVRIVIPFHGSAA